MRNEFSSIQLAPKKLSVAAVNISAGGSNKALVATPGAGKRLRIYGIVINNTSTAKDVITVHFASGNTILKQEILSNAVNPIAPTVVMFNPNYVEGGDNQALQADVTDQATDDWDITVYYTVEDN